MNADKSLDKIIAQKLGELTILTAKQSIIIDAMKREIAARDAEIVRIKTA